MKVGYHRWSRHIDQLIKQLNKEQQRIGVKNKPRCRQLIKAKKEEQIHEFKSNY